ncbi:MAG: hypothetical protein N2652_01905 [Kiritimatiellae bacterium]|nr:hypothetical protein [Kiritimatiellia bacterium]
MTAAIPRAEERRRRFVPVLAAEPEIAARFVAALLPDSPSGGVVDIANHHVFLEAVSAVTVEDTAWKARLRQADAAAVLVHFLDHRLLEAAAALVREAAMAGVPAGVFIYRAQAERQFKISCDHCGQKLWVLEEEIGRRGRCVACHQPIQIVSPAERVRARMNLPDAVPVLNVVEANIPLCRGALANLLVRIGAGPTDGDPASSREFLKRATVPIQITRGSAP